MEISKQIEQDLDWRLAELIELKKLAISVSGFEGAYGAQLRAMWVMLYAHYEGFCKFIISIFLEELEKTGTVRNLFREELIIFSLEEELTNLRKDTSAKSCYDYFKDRFSVALESAIKFKRNRRSEYQILGSNNLTCEDLSEMCKCICINEEIIGNSRLQLNALVSRRNEIAHGKSHPIKNVKDYQKYENAATNVMVALALAVIESLESEKYLK